MTDYEEMAQGMFERRFFPEGDNAAEQQPFVLVHAEKQDVLILVDRRQNDRRDREWMGFRNYLYGWNRSILAERTAPDYAIMVIDASHDLQERFSREFLMLTLVQKAEIPPDLASNPEVVEMVENFSRPELHHRYWGKVVVENGKPIGLMVNGELVRQSVTKHWMELEESDDAE